MQTPTTTFDLIIVLRQQIIAVEQEQFEWRQRLRRMRESYAQRQTPDALEQHAFARATARQELKFYQERVLLLTNIIACNDLAYVGELNAAAPIRRKGAEAQTQQNMTLAVAEKRHQAPMAKIDTSHELAAVEVTEKRAVTLVTFRDEAFVL
jgi:hypothetical protein